MKEFSSEDWPDDGTDWDGVHDEVMKQILGNLEKAEKYQQLGNVNKLCLDAIQWRNHQKTIKEGGRLMDKFCVEDAIQEHEIVERLKKRIEELQKNPPNTIDIHTVEALQEILSKLKVSS